MQPSGQVLDVHTACSQSPHTFSRTPGLIRGVLRAGYCQTHGADAFSEVLDFSQKLESLATNAVRASERQVHLVSSLLKRMAASRPSEERHSVCQSVCRSSYGGGSAGGVGLGTAGSGHSQASWPPPAAGLTPRRRMLAAQLRHSALCHGIGPSVQRAHREAASCLGGVVRIADFLPSGPWQRPRDPQRPPHPTPRTTPN